MADMERLGNNIRILRNAFHETQKELAYAVHVNHNEISYYERCERLPSHETIEAIAKHFSMSVEELVYEDFSALKDISIDRFALFRNIKSILPIVTSERAMENEYFRRANKYHHEMFDMMSRFNFDAFYNIDNCYEQYWKAAEEDEEIGEEVVANVIAFLYLFQYFTNVPYMLKTKPAALNQVLKRDEKAKITLEQTDPSFEQDAAIVRKELQDEGYQSGLHYMKIILKQSVRYSELGDYYLALQYAWNIVDNNLPAEFNVRVGGEMMKTLESVENHYAADYLKTQIEIAGFKFHNE